MQCNCNSNLALLHGINIKCKAGHIPTYTETMFPPSHTNTSKAANTNTRSNSSTELNASHNTNAKILKNFNTG